MPVESREQRRARFDAVNMTSTLGPAIGGTVGVTQLVFLPEWMQYVTLPVAGIALIMSILARREVEKMFNGPE